MNSYVILGSACGGVSGGIIYHRNKLLYLEKHGWKAYMLSSTVGKVHIGGLEPYVIGSYSFLMQFPSSFPLSLQKQNVSMIIGALKRRGISNPIVESSTETTALWGELIAKELKCKHVIIYINEFSQCMTNSLAQFFEFKFNRQELACISKEHMVSIFGKFWHVTIDNAISLTCSCSNSLQKCQSPLNNIGFPGKTIGYIGRIDKFFFDDMSLAIVEFARRHTQDQFSFVVFGGSAQNKALKKLEQKCKSVNNLLLYVTGFIYPIPFDATQKVDIFFACAGSSNVAYKTGIPCISINSVNYQIDGLLKSISPQRDFLHCSLGETYEDYLEWILYRETNIPRGYYDLNEDEKIIDKKLQEHIAFLSNSDSSCQYYPVNHVSVIYKKDYIKKMLRFLFHSNLNSLKNPFRKYQLKKN